MSLLASSHELEKGHGIPKCLVKNLHNSFSTLIQELLALSMLLLYQLSSI